MRRSRARFGLTSAVALAILLALGACTAGTRYYQCSGDEQCALANVCARHCAAEIERNESCEQFSADAPAACARFLDVATRPDRRIHIKRDPFY